MRSGMAPPTGRPAPAPPPTRFGPSAVQARPGRVPAGHGGSTIQAQFSIKGSTVNYDNAETVKARETYIKGRIRQALPPGVTADDVIQAIKDMADDPNPFGTFSWDQIIEEAVRALTPAVDEEINYGNYTPQWQRDDTPPTSPTNSEYFGFARKFSGDFSDMLKEETGFTASDMRDSRMKIESKDFEIEATTYGAGRFTNMTGQRILGDTKYGMFLPQLPKKTGLTSKQVAETLLDGLLDKAAFKIRLTPLDEKQKTALLQTVILLSNEIIHRSSVNLVEIVGALKRTVEDDSKTFTERFEETGSWVPTAKENGGIGGQKLSRTHHIGGDVLDSVNPDLLEIFNNHKRSVGNLAAMHDVDIGDLAAEYDDLCKKFIENFNSSWTIKKL